MKEYTTCKYGKEESIFEYSDDAIRVMDRGKLLDHNGVWGKPTVWCLKNGTTEETGLMITCEYKKEKECGYYINKYKRKKIRTKVKKINIIKEVMKPFIIKTKQKDKPDIEISSDRYPLTSSNVKDRKTL